MRVPAGGPLVASGIVLLLTHRQLSWIMVFLGLIAIKNALDLMARLRPPDDD